MRISATDWVEKSGEEGGWDLPQSVQLAALLRDRGVDLVDVSSGGNVLGAAMTLGPGYQTPFSEAIRTQTGIQFLRDPYWPLHAAAALGETASWPAQYLRAAAAKSPARSPVGNKS